MAIKKFAAGQPLPVEASSHERQRPTGRKYRTGHLQE